MSQPLKEKDMNTYTSNQQNYKAFGFKDKFGYMFGDWGNDFFFLLTTTYLTVFYTDVFHMNPAIVGTLFLIARIWDAIADVLWGRFIDSREPTKNGKFRPWIKRMSLPLVIVGVLMFVKIPGMPMGFYEAYAFVTYILWGTLYSTVNIPYGSMAAVITQDPAGRTSLSAFRSFGGTLAQFFVSAVGPLLLFVNNQATASRFFMGAVIFGILAMACYVATYKMTTERVPTQKSNNSVGNLGQSLKAMGKNRPLIWILVATTFFLIGFMLLNTIMSYLFKDYFGSAKAMSIAGVIQIVSVLCAMPLVNPMVKKFGKKETGAMGLAIAVLTFGILYFTPHISLTVYLIFFFIGFFGFGGFNLIIWAYVTDVLDYHEYITDKREDGTLYSIYSFARKIGQAIAGGIGGFALSFIGYNSSQDVQSEATLDGIYTVATIVPALLLLVVFLILVFLYPLNKKRTNQLVYDLEEKRKRRNQKE